MHYVEMDRWLTTLPDCVAAMVVLDIPKPRRDNLLVCKGSVALNQRIGPEVVAPVACTSRYSPLVVGSLPESLHYRAEHLYLEEIDGLLLRA